MRYMELSWFLSNLFVLVWFLCRLTWKVGSWIGDIKFFLHVSDEFLRSRETKTEILPGKVGRCWVDILQMGIFTSACMKTHKRSTIHGSVNIPSHGSYGSNAAWFYARSKMRESLGWQKNRKIMEDPRNQRMILVKGGTDFWKLI